MKLAVRIFAMSVVLAGAAAAAVSSSAKPVPSRQVSSSMLPAPVCSPSIPTCPK